MRKAYIALASLALVALLVSPAAALPPTSFTDEDAMELFGHTFDEEYWTAEDVDFQQPNGAEVSFAVSYAQYKAIDTFLVAFNTHERDGNVSTLPYQLFGLHYYTPLNQEVLIGAVMAFLMAFNDTYNGTGPGQNGLPDPGNEDVYYIIPFGIGGVLDDEQYVPEVEPLPVEKLGEGHFRFGQRYTNLYAKVIGSNNPLELLLSTAFPVYIARFSELTVEYEVKVDEQAGTVTAETFYDIGQVDKLWLWGQEVDPHGFDENWGIAAVHYVVVFATAFNFVRADPKVDIATNITEEMDEDISIAIGEDRERAFTIGHRGKYDLIDEDSGTKLVEDEDAVALTLQSRAGDYIMLAWQAAMSRDIFATAAWAVSENLQGLYASPRALQTMAGATFVAAPLWYATSFPGWDGYRVEHDPTYTAFANVEGIETAPEDQEPTPGFLLPTALLAIAIPAILAYNRKRVLI